jgi:hypothetical protein
VKPGGKSEYALQQTHSILWELQNILHSPSTHIQWEAFQSEQSQPFIFPAIAVHVLVIHYLKRGRSNLKVLLDVGAVTISQSIADIGQ